MKNILLMIFSIGLTANVFAQSVSGKVTDSDGMELPGVSILIKGSSSGTTTGIDGSYTISASSTDVLVFSFVGFETQEVAVGNRSTINVTMATDVKTLQEVVVIGYGEVERADATGAISSISADDFNGGVISSPEQLFQGKAAGVQITTNSGEPGGGISIRIRGTSSIRSGNNPLFVIDGVPLAGNDVSSGVGSPMGSQSAKNPLNFLNPNDIESIDILKDASATAIYGSRGANGVIIITTKKGKKGEGTLDYSYNLGISNVSNRYDLLSASEFVDAWSSYNPGIDPAAIDYGADTDWQDEVYQTAYTQQHNLSFGAGTEKGSYRASLSVQDQQGVIKESGMKRITARFNGDRSFMDDKLKVKSQFTVASIHDDNVMITNNSGFEGDLMGAVIKLNPTLPVYNPDGTHFQLSLTEPSPVAILELSDAFTNTLRAMGSISLGYEITDGLTINSSYSIDKSISQRKDAYSRDLKVRGVTPEADFVGGRLIHQESGNDNTSWESYLDYNKSTGNMEINAILGYSYLTFENSYTGWQAAGFRTSDLQTMLYNTSSALFQVKDIPNPDYNPRAGDLGHDPTKPVDEDPDVLYRPGSVVPINSGLTKDELQSFFTRAVVKIGNKYIVTATLRADGSTRFGPGNQYGYFPSAAFKWRLGSEGFMPEKFEDLAFRVGYGVTGNQEFGHNLYTTRQRYGSYGINSGGNFDLTSLSDVAFANPALKWESTVQFNSGFDFSFVGGKLTGSLDYYYKNTKDMLIRVDAAQPAPQPFVWKNLEDANVINTGVDLGLNYVVMDNEDFSWDVSGNVSYNYNVVHGGPSLLINTGAINGQGLSGAFAQRIADGQPLYAFFLREFTGFSADGTVQEYAGGDVQKFVGASPLPKVNAGLSNNFRYGDFSLSLFFNGQFGHYIYSNTENAFFTAGSIAGGRNVRKDVIGNGEARTNAPDVATRFLEKGDFVRFQNATLGYNVPLNSDKISSVRLFVTGQNIAVFTKYSGQDPEVNVDKNINGIPSFGIDYTTYPRARTWTMGVNVGF